MENNLGIELGYQILETNDNESYDYHKEIVLD